MKCFHHDDADGICSAYWVALIAKVIDSDCYKNKPEFYEMNYRKRFPLEIVRPDEQVYIVDFSISSEDMRELLSVTKNVTWIDHHKTAIEKYENFEHSIRGVRYDGIAACMLTYCYLKHMTAGGEGEIISFNKSMISDAPLFTRYIADSDVFDFKYGEDTKNFFIAFKSYCFEPLSDKWKSFTEDGRQEMKMVEEGRIISVYEKEWAKDYIKMGFVTIFEGYKCYAVNLGYSGIEFFNSLPEGAYDIFISFAFDGEQYVVSMYSRTVDVSPVAIKYGGGGHKMAAGFQCISLPFKKNATE